MMFRLSFSHYQINKNFKKKKRLLAHWWIKFTSLTEKYSNPRLALTEISLHTDNVVQAYASFQWTQKLNHFRNFTYTAMKGAISILCTSCSLGDKWVDPFLRSGYDDLRAWDGPINGVPLRPLDERFGSEAAGVRSAKVNTWPAALSGDDE